MGLLTTEERESESLLEREESMWERRKTKNKKRNVGEKSKPRTHVHLELTYIRQFFQLPFDTKLVISSLSLSLFLYVCFFFFVVTLIQSSLYLCTHTDF